MVIGIDAELVLPKSKRVEGNFSAAKPSFLRMVSLIIRFAWWKTR